MRTLIIAFCLSAVACATTGNTSTQSQPAADEERAKILSEQEELEKKYQALQAKLDEAKTGETDAVSEVQPQAEQAAPAPKKALKRRYTRTRVVAAPMGQAATPMMAPMPVLPPAPNWGTLYSPPPGCDGGPLSLRVDNAHQRFFIKVFVDGQEQVVQGSGGSLPLVPPQQSLFMCLNRIGRHVVEAVRYTNNNGMLQEIDRMSYVLTIESTATHPYVTFM